MNDSSSIRPRRHRLPFPALFAGALLVQTFLGSGCASSPGTGGSGSFRGIPWTDRETEEYWAAVCGFATSTSTAPRTEGADETTGEGILSTFGTQYVPNAYALYEKARDYAKEREQVLAETFPGAPESLKTENSRAIYQRARSACAKAVAVYFRRHDELCQLYLLHKTGFADAGELAKLDSKPLAVMLPHHASGGFRKIDAKPEPLSADETNFASVHMPESLAAWNHLTERATTLSGEYEELVREATILDAQRSGVVLDAVWWDGIGSVNNANTLANAIRASKLRYSIEETDGVSLAKLDETLAKTAAQWETRLADRSETSLFSRGNADAQARYALWMLPYRPVTALLQSVVPVPGESWGMCRFEVARVQWDEVLSGSFPEKGISLPASGTWHECQDFLAKLNARPEVRSAGVRFRIPSREEWLKACLAGGKGPVGRSRDGREIDAASVGFYAFDNGNSKGTLHPVGQLYPNAWGLHDMLGNQSEWVKGCIRYPFGLISKFSESKAREFNYTLDMSVSETVDRYILNYQDTDFSTPREKCVADSFDSSERASTMEESSAMNLPNWPYNMPPSGMKHGLRLCCERIE